MPRGREITDADRLDAGLKAAQQAVGEAGGLSEPLILAEDVDLAKYEDWAVGKTGAGSFVFVPDEPGAQLGTALMRADYRDLHDLIGGTIQDQVTEQLLRVVGPKGLRRLKAGHLQLRIGTHSREPYLALIPEKADGPVSPSIVVEAAYLVETEEQLIQDLKLWMSDASECQVAIGVKVFADWYKASGEAPRMVAYLAQRGHAIRGPIPFGPTSPCGRPGLAQYQLFLPLQQVFHGAQPPERLAYPLRIDLFGVQRDVCSAIDVIGNYLREPFTVTVKNHQPH